MPQLSQRRIDGYYAAEPPRSRCASAIPVHGPENLHRLPQGHRSQVARYAQYSGMAVTNVRGARALPCRPCEILRQAKVAIGGTQITAAARPHLRRRCALRPRAKAGGRSAARQETRGEKERKRIRKTKGGKEMSR